MFSYAGRTASPTVQPIPTRVGGFGGADGLAAYLCQEGISHVIDATHPFASRMSHNAERACALTTIPLLALERPPWLAQAGDNWLDVADATMAAACLPATPGNVFLAIGRQNLDAFTVRPEHHYLLRLVDPLPPELALQMHLPRVTVLVDKGPFTEVRDRAIMEEHHITHVVAKNAGGSAARAKLEAARALRLPVIMIARPVQPDRHSVGSVDAVMAWLSHQADLGV